MENTATAFDRYLEVMTLFSNLSWLFFLIFILSLVMLGYYMFRFHDKEHMKTLYSQDLEAFRKAKDKGLAYNFDDVTLRYWKENRMAFDAFVALLEDNGTNFYAYGMTFHEFVEDLPADLVKSARETAVSVYQCWPGHEPMAGEYASKYGGFVWRYCFYDRQTKYEETHPRKYSDWDIHVRKTDS